MTGKAQRFACPGYILAAASVLFFAIYPAPANAAGLELPPSAQQGLNLLYSTGEPERALEIFRQMEKSDPTHPLGFLLEADALWWQIYCEACEIKWNTIDAWDRPDHADDAYISLLDKTISLADQRIAKRDSAEMELYAGMAWALKARVLGLHNGRRATAHAGVTARSYLLRCLQLDPQMADAYAGLGLYNYYADALSTMARILRFFMGIPGGSKQEGIRQLHIAMDSGPLTGVEARFYLAKALRNFDQDYATAAQVMTPLLATFPQNPYFRLQMADIEAKLGRREAATASFHAAEQTRISNSRCLEIIRSLTRQSLSSLSAARK